MAFLENEVLKYQYRLIPLQSSHTQSGASSDGGRPESNPEDLSDAGSKSKDTDNRRTE